ENERERAGNKRRATKKPHHGAGARQGDESCRADQHNRSVGPRVKHPYALVPGEIANRKRSPERWRGGDGMTHTATSRLSPNHARRGRLSRNNSTANRHAASGNSFNKRSMRAWSDKLARCRCVNRCNISLTISYSARGHRPACKTNKRNVPRT